MYLSNIMSKNSSKVEIKKVYLPIISVIIDSADNSGEMTIFRCRSEQIPPQCMTAGWLY